MFSHLHVHSQYSILDSTSSVKELAQAAAKEGMDSLALTDHGNLYGTVDFYKACRSENVKPIIGCEIYLAPQGRLKKERTPGIPVANHVTLLAKNQKGYQNLCRLSSIGFLEGFYYFPRIDKQVLEEHSEGLICLSGCIRGPLAHQILNGTAEGLSEEIEWFHRVFKNDFYFELMRHPMDQETFQSEGFTQETWLMQQYEEHQKRQETVNQALLQESNKRGVPIVATNDCHYLEREDWRAHEILLNVQSGEPCEVWERDSFGKPTFRKPNPKRKTYPTHELYFKSSQQMESLFQDLPEAISNTRVIADQCNVALDFETKHYPVFIPPEWEGKKISDEKRKKEAENYLQKLCEEGLEKRYTEENLQPIREQFPDQDPMELIRKRLDYELSIIIPKGLCDYLLIVWDFIHWSKSQGIPVGPGRGSGVGSIVLYLIGVTDIEPLRFHLFFERFINPERLSYPDIDVDICMERRGEVIQYTLEKYGKNNVAQIITFGTMKAKMSIKDVGRVLSVPLTKVNAIAKLVPDDLNITLEKALEKDPDLKNVYDTDEEAKRVIDLARRLEGSIRNTGIHAAGLVVSGEPLTDHIPVCQAKDSVIPATQFSMKPVEQVGMLKIDFLGLKTLTSIHKCVEAIVENHDHTVEWMNLPLDDPKTYQLLNQGKTSGIFQLESSGMQDLAKQLHLDRFEEIIAVGALYRPGPMDMIPSFIARKHGREKIEYDHEWMKQILSETNGIMVYQEQVMQIASELANYTLGEGDVLRKAMGKKDRDEMQRQRKKFLNGAKENQISDETAALIFDKMEKFASYGFNKSHAAAYAYISYVTAYLKSNFPSEWMAALMTCDRDDTAKIGKHINEAKSIGIDTLPPDVNESGKTFTATPVGVRFALTAIKGVGESVVEAILEERKNSGPFQSLHDFIQRVDERRVGKKAIENLVDAGSFDFTGWSRDALRQSVEAMYNTAIKEKKEKQAGVLNLFSDLDSSEELPVQEEPTVEHSSSPIDLLLKEKELLGFFLTGHPMELYQHVLERLSTVSLHEIITSKEGVYRSAFLVEDVGVRFSARTQKKFAILTIGDGTVRFELPIWPDLYEEHAQLLEENRLLYAVLSVEQRDGESRTSCRWLGDLTQANQEMISICDQAFDQAKHQQARFKMMKSKGGSDPKKRKKEMTKKVEKLLITVDANQTSQKKILELKKILEQHPGPSPIRMEFVAGPGPIASLHCDPSKGISLEPIEKELDKIDWVIASSREAIKES